MKLTMSTVTLQAMVTKAMKGASCNRMIPLTTFLAISLKNGKLTLITSDATNYLYVSEDEISGDDFYVVVQAEIFSKLISRLTCEHISLELLSSRLAVIGNGEYSIELPLDENGELIVYPDPLSRFEFGESETVSLSMFKLLLLTSKASLALTSEIPCYTGYYFGESVITSDTCQVCDIKMKLLSQPALINADMINLFDVMANEKVEVYRDADVIVFNTPNCTIYGTVMDCIGDYQVDAIEGLVNTEYPSKCKVLKSEMLQLLDRLELFVSNYDKNGIYLNFTQNGLMITSKQSTSAETLNYLSSENFSPFTCCIDITMMRNQVKATTGDSIEIHYGMSNAIKFTDGNVTQLLCLIEDDRLS